jgi:hypothetical protein
VAVAWNATDIAPVHPSALNGFFLALRDIQNDCHFYPIENIFYPSVLF